MSEDVRHGRRNGGKGIEEWDSSDVPAKRKHLSGAELESIAELRYAGHSIPEISGILGISVNKINSTLNTDRYKTMARLVGSGSGNVIERARLRYRVLKANDVLDRSLNSDNQWLAYSAAVQVLQSDERRRKEENDSRVEVILTSDFLTCGDDSADDPGDPGDRGDNGEQ